MQKGRYFRAILEVLGKLGGGIYNIYYEILNTRAHGIPQNRPRVYFVGILKVCDRGDFKFPAPVPCGDLSRLLGPPAADAANRTPPPANKYAFGNHMFGMWKIQHIKKKDPYKEPSGAIMEFLILIRI
jgi:site-specific DNA-cytosine methylase